MNRIFQGYCSMPGGAERGGHAHKQLHQLIIAMSGRFDVVLDDETDYYRDYENYLAAQGLR